MPQFDFEASLSVDANGKAQYSAGLKDDISNRSFRVSQPFLDLAMHPPLGAALNEGSEQVDLLVYHLDEVLRTSLVRLDYSPPMRDPSQRFYRAATAVPRAVSGTGIAEDLRSLGASVSSGRPLVEQWLKRFDIADTINVVSLLEGLWLVELRDRVTGIKSNLADFGFGTSQVLPLILYMASSYASGSKRHLQDRVLIVQQPEVHLHPEAQLELGDLFAAMAMQGIQVIVETHSEHLVKRIQRRVLDSTLSASDVAILFVEQSARGSQATEIPLDSSGLLARELPAGFLDTAYSEALEFHRERTGPDR